MTLLKLKDGQTGMLVEIDRNAECYERLLELGFTFGESISVLRRAPLGGPIQVEVRGTRYAIGLSDAAHIKVSL